MAESGDNNFMRYIYRGEEGEIIPRLATHIFVHESVTVIRADAFFEHPNIVEVICHEDVEKIEENAFFYCYLLGRVIMPGVKIVGEGAFTDCDALTDVECDKLEIIKQGAFNCCKSLRSINLSSVRIVKWATFGHCEALTDLKFGTKLERFEGYACSGCKSLERITIPLKNGLITNDNTFKGCEKLNHVDLLEEDGALHKAIAALHLEEWRNDIYEEIYSINQTLPNAPAGDDYEDVGEKAVAIRTWIGSLLDKIMHYKEEHRRLLEEDVVPTLQRVVPQDIVTNNVLPFLELPSNAFE